MWIKKIFNNNIILAHDEKMAERILLGRGIAFGKKENDKVDETKIDKIFILESQELVDKFVHLVGEIPTNHLELTDKIVKEAENRLHVKFNDSIYIGLADHINYALFRFKNGEQIQNAFLWEIKKFYPNEFQVALDILEIIFYYEKVKLSDDEASFIALHFVNGQNSNYDLNLNGIKETIIIQDTFNIIKFHYSIDIEENTLNYSRFVTHLRYFLQRITRQERYDADENQLFDQVSTKYVQAYKCVLKINNYLIKKIDIKMTKEEQLYFILHINRLTDRENQIRSN